MKISCNMNHQHFFIRLLILVCVSIQSSVLKAQEEFGNLQTFQELHDASVLIIGVALHLARGLGAETKEISEHWIEIAKSHGAKE